MTTQQEIERLAENYTEEGSGRELFKAELGRLVSMAMLEVLKETKL